MTTNQLLHSEPVALGAQLETWSSSFLQHINTTYSYDCLSTRKTKKKLQCKSNWVTCMTTLTLTDTPFETFRWDLPAVFITSGCRYISSFLSRPVIDCNSCIHCSSQMWFGLWERKLAWFWVGNICFGRPLAGILCSICSTNRMSHCSVI